MRMQMPPRARIQATAGVDEREAAQRADALEGLVEEEDEGEREEGEAGESCGRAKREGRRCGARSANG